MADKDGKDQFIANALPDKNSMDEVLAALEHAKVVVGFSAASEQQRRPLAPFITSQLQRDAAGKLGFNVRRTMGVRNDCMNGVDLGPEGTTGLITTCVRFTACLPRCEGECARVDWGRILARSIFPRRPNDYKGQEGCAGCSRSDPPTVLRDA